MREGAPAATAGGRPWLASDTDMSSQRGSEGISSVVARKGDGARVAMTCRRLTADDGVKVRRALGSAAHFLVLVACPRR